MFNDRPDRDAQEETLRAELEIADRVLREAPADAKEEARREYLRVLKRFATFVREKLLD